MGHVTGSWYSITLTVHIMTWQAHFDVRILDTACQHGFVSLSLTFHAIGSNHHLSSSTFTKIADGNTNTHQERVNTMNSMTPQSVQYTILDPSSDNDGVVEIDVDQDYDRIPSARSVSATSSEENEDSFVAMSNEQGRVTSSADYRKSWEPDIADRIAHRLEQFQEDRPFMVALVGIPGCGKSVSAMILANELECRYHKSCFVTPHDGYHYPLEYLKTLPDAEDVIYRRGAPDTFDVAALYHDLQRLRGEIGTPSNGGTSPPAPEKVIRIPGFDHEHGDPEPDKHMFVRSMHLIVICEGLYLLHDHDGWENIASMFDFSIYIDIDINVSMDRVAIRNQCIPGYTPEEIAVRVDRVDRVNAMKVLRSRSRATVIVDPKVDSSRPLPNLSQTESSVSLGALDIASGSTRGGSTANLTAAGSRTNLSLVGSRTSLAAIGSKPNLSTVGSKPNLLSASKSRGSFIATTSSANRSTPIIQPTESTVSLAALNLEDGGGGTMMYALQSFGGSVSSMAALEF